MYGTPAHVQDQLARGSASARIEPWPANLAPSCRHVAQQVHRPSDAIVVPALTSSVQLCIRAFPLHRRLAAGSRAPYATRLSVCGSFTVMRVAIEVGVWLAVDLRPAPGGRAPAAGCPARPAECCPGTPPGMRLEVQVERLLGDQQVGVDLRPGSTARTSGSRSSSGCPCSRSVPIRIRHAVGQHVEVDGALVVVEEEGVVERRGLPRLPQVCSPPSTPRRIR